MNEERRDGGVEAVTLGDLRPADEPFGNLSDAHEAGFADDVSHFRLRDYGPEDWLAMVLLWVMSVLVFLQFATRYFLNNSISWTEEMARYLLIGITFVGSAAAVRKNTHIHVEFFYRYFGRRFGLGLSTFVDVLRTAFFALCTWISWGVMQIMGTQMMDSLGYPLSYVYAVVFIGFAAMTIRSVQTAVRHWRSGSSALTQHDIAGPQL